MDTHENLTWIPEYVSEDVRQKLIDLTVESAPEVSEVECSENLIRHWCETVEDGNPLYLDREYARSRGFRAEVAQPGMLVCTLTLPYRWPWPPKGHTPGRNIHFELKELLQLPVGILADYETRFFRYVELGDRLSGTNRLVSISPWRKTKLGEGHFWVIENAYRNQDGELVAEVRTTLFAYGRT